MLNQHLTRARFVFVVCALLVCVEGASAPALAQSSSFPHLIWSDEFNGANNAAVNSTNWNYETGDGCSMGNCGWGNNERQYYTNFTNNVSLDGQGHLRIVARTSTGMNCYYGPCLYTSAKITTKAKYEFKYGRIEARIKLPAGQGLWPALWMLGNDFPITPWPASGEIDIMENRGSNPNATISALHGPGYSGSTPFNHAYSFPSGQDVTAFHVYAVEWEPSQIRFYVDGSLHYTVNQSEVTPFGTWVFDHPFYIILNLAVGGNFDGHPASDSIFPATMLVDYVRVYQECPGLQAPALNYYGTGTPTLTWNQITGPANYQIHVDETPLFFTPVIYETNALSQMLTPSLSFGVHYWRVRAARAVNEWGQWSQTQSFCIDLP